MRYSVSSVMAVAVLVAGTAQASVQAAAQRPASQSATIFAEMLAAVPDQTMVDLVNLLTNNGTATADQRSGRVLTFIQFLNGNNAEFDRDPAAFLSRVLQNRGLIEAADHKKVSVNVIQTGPSWGSVCACKLYLDLNCTPGVPMPGFGGMSGCGFSGCLVNYSGSCLAFPGYASAGACVKDALARRHNCLCSGGLDCNGGTVPVQASYCNQCQ